MKYTDYFKSEEHTSGESPCYLLTFYLLNNNIGQKLTLYAISGYVVQNDGTYLSQGIAEIRHFRKSLGISGNAWAIEKNPVLPRQLRKTQAFPESPLQLKNL